MVVPGRPQMTINATAKKDAICVSDKLRKHTGGTLNI